MKGSRYLGYRTILTSMVIASFFMCALLASTPVRATDSVFHLQTVETNALGTSMSQTQMAIDAQGHAHVVYGKAGEGGAAIFYATDQKGTWETKKIDGPFSSYSISSWTPLAYIAIDSAGRINILYNTWQTPIGGNTYSSIKLATKLVDSSGDFSLSTLFPGQDTFVRSMCLGPSDVLWMLFNNQTNVNYATKAPGGSWEVSNIPIMSPSNYGSRAIAVGPDGNPQIAAANESSFYNETIHDWTYVHMMEYIHMSAGVWHKEVVDNATGRDYFVQIGLNSTNAPRIMYGRDDGQAPAGSQQVRYVERSGTGWGTPQVLQSYSFIFWFFGSMSMRGDITHMVYLTPTAGSTTQYSDVMNYTHGKGSSFVTQAVSTTVGGASPCLIVDASGGQHLTFTSVDSDLNTNLIYATTTSASSISQPLDLQATAGNGSVALKWSAPANSDGLVGYVVQISDSSSFSTIMRNGTVSGSTLSYTASGLTNGVSYYFRVKAVSATSAGPSSEVVSATPNTPSSGTAGGSDSTVIIIAIVVVVAVAGGAGVYLMRRKK